MPIPLQTQWVYGPLISRRFGNSLGVNFLPLDRKFCNFDCVYCQYGPSHSDAPLSLPAPEDLEQEFLDFAAESVWKAEAIDCITIAGNGEPTLHPRFKEMIETVLRARDQFFPGVPVGILSNASTCRRTEIREALALVDERFMKLDAGTQSRFESVNEPCGHGLLHEIIDGLCRMDDIVIQSLFFDGDVKQNIDPHSVEDWIGAVEKIRPRSVQIYTIDRSPRDRHVGPVPAEVLKSIAQQLTERTQISAVIY